ncbi:MAG: hypothetical protein R2941_24410 [Desulfobacterales bacterium]
MTEYMTVPKLAQKLELSDNTVRRYTKNYPQFFRPEMREGWEYFPVEESLKVIRRINEISAAGKRRSEVVAELEKDFPVVRPVSTGEDTDSDPDGGLSGQIEFGPKSMALLIRMADALERIAELQK